MPNRISDANTLYEAWLAAKKGTIWKTRVQMFEYTWLYHIAELQKQIESNTYMPAAPSRFVIYERGKPRVIRGEQIRDRVLEHALNDTVVIPAIEKYLIYDNGASLKGKGIDFTRRRLVKHLTSFYHKYGNDGYILLIDYSKYYDNIHHDILLNQFKKYITDETALRLIETIVKTFKVDVSYLSDEEYATCMDNVFNSLEHEELFKQFKTEHKSDDVKPQSKYMYKHLDIGNQTSQSAGILYPTPIDNYFKIVKGEKYYARYMDDSYCISNSKEHLEELRQDLIRLTKQHGIVLNENKTRIVKLSSMWRFLQIQYSLTDTGRIIRKINPKQVTTMRRKMKLLAFRMTFKEFHDWTNSWIQSHKKYLSNQQYNNIVRLYHELEGVTR